MKKFFLKDASGEMGPFNIEELRSRNISADTQVRYEDADQWMSAGQVEELKQALFTPQVAAATASAPEEKKAEKTAPASSMKPVNPAGKKSTAWVSYVLALVVLGGAGYYVYQDMEKNKQGTEKTAGAEMTQPATDTTAVAPTTSPTPTATTDTTTAPSTVTDTTATGDLTTAPTTTKPTDPNAAKNLLADQAKKIQEENKKKQLAAQEAKKKEEAKKLAAAKAAAAREMEMRNNWQRYITVGALNYQEHDGIKGFPIPVYNTTTAVLDKVTLRVDYLKKEGKTKETETLVLYNIPPKSQGSVQASGNKKAKTVNVYITAVNSRGLHFCYPTNNGNPADPYYCK